MQVVSVCLEATPVSFVCAQEVCLLSVRRMCLERKRKKTSDIWLRLEVQKREDRLQNK